MSERSRPTEAEREYVEEFALFYEQVGMTRMAGRILAWLLICEPPQQSIGEIAEALGASKSAVSTGLRLLTQPGFVTRFSPVGQRSDAFSIKPGIWRQLMEARMAQLAAFRQLAERGLTLLESTPPERRRRLEEMRSMYAFVEEEAPALFRRWGAD